jgi:hypothetical protein
MGRKIARGRNLVASDGVCRGAWFLKRWFLKPMVFNSNKAKNKL